MVVGPAGFKVQFTANRKVPILSCYRPDWTSDSKPEYNCASLFFNDKEFISQGEMHICTLTPIKYSFWSEVKVGDILKCMEGPKEVGEAVVLTEFRMF